MYPVLYVGFHCKGCVWKRVWKFKANLRLKEFSRVAHKKPSREVKQVLSTWLECEESWQMVTIGFRECFTGKAFPLDTRKTFYFAILSYLIYLISTYTIYTPITHICWGVILRQNS